jgi:hypothetical protein
VSNSNEPTDVDEWYEARYRELDENDPFWDDDEQECPACYGTGIEDGDLYDPDAPPCLDCGGWGAV